MLVLARPAVGLIEHRVGDLTLVAPPGEQAELDRLSQLAAIILPRLAQDLGQGVAAPFRIYLLPRAGLLDPELERLNAAAPPWASGFLLGAHRIGGIRLGSLLRYPYDDTATVLAHEITHQVLYDAAGDLPRWLSEGIATWEGRRWGLRDFAVQSVSLVGGRLPSLVELERGFVESPGAARRAYAASFDFVSWSERRYGPDFVPRLLRAARSGSIEEAWRSASGEELAASESRWRRKTLFLHRWLPLLASSGSLWLAITGLALVAGVVRRRRTRALYARWDAEEAALEARPQVSNRPRWAEHGDP